jgi:hypothetical protein
LSNELSCQSSAASPMKTSKLSHQIACQYPRFASVQSYAYIPVPCSMYCTTVLYMVCLERSSNGQEIHYTVQYDRGRTVRLEWEIALVGCIKLMLIFLHVSVSQQQWPCSPTKKIAHFVSNDQRLHPDSFLQYDEFKQKVISYRRLLASSTTQRPCNTRHDS